MAAPSEVTIKDLSGKFVMDKSLSDDIDPVLALQGIGWLTRKAVGLATITLHVKQYNDADNITHIDIEQTATGGIKGTTELRHLAWKEVDREDHLFGKVVAKSRWIKLEDIEEPFLKEDWLEGEAEAGGPAGETHVESYAQSPSNGWVADQIWGFATINGQRHYVRRVVVTKGSESIKARLVYAWQGK